MKLMLPVQTAWTYSIATAVITASMLATSYVIYMYISKRNRLRRLGSRAVALPHRLPFGFDTAFRMLRGVFTDTFMELQAEFLKHGHVVEASTAGSTYFFTDEPEIFQAVMSTKFTDFGKGQIVHDVFIGSMSEAIFCTDGDKWRSNRALLRPHCAKSRPTDLDITEEHFREVMKIISDRGQPVEVWDLIDRYQLDVATHVFFGKSADSLTTNKQPFRDAMENLLKIACFKMTFGTLGTKIPDWLVAPGSIRELNKYVKTLYDLAYASDYSKKPQEELNLLEELAFRGLSFDELKAQVSAIMLGGKDPPTLTMTWALWEMARNPAIYAKVRAEIARVCGFERPPTADELKECHYIRWCANEAMRLYHPLAINMKCALNDTTLPTGGGPSGKEPVGVLKGSNVVLSLWTMSRRIDLFGEDAETFRPERWDGWKPQWWSFLPFNHGLRTCIGQKFGQQQVEFFIARIAQEFGQIHVPAEQIPMGYKLELNVKPLHPCLVCFLR